MSDVTLEVSFILPTYNEEKSLERTIQSIREQLSKVPHEIIVVDNGSSDLTIDIADRLADKVYSDPAARIGRLRNIGASNASGDILVFNDADVVLAKDWFACFSGLSLSLLSEPIIVGGSLDVGDGQFASFKYWFRPLLKSKQSGGASYVGSGHMIMSRKTFGVCGGFSESLRTGEDFELCMRAKLKAISVIYAHDLHVIHDDYPTTIFGFFRREQWHGKGDFSGINTFLKSRVAVASTVFLGLQIFAALLALLGHYQYSLISFSFVVTLVVAMSYSKFPDAMGVIGRFRNFGFCYLYLLGRSVSWV